MHHKVLDPYTYTHTYIHSFIIFEVQKDIVIPSLGTPITTCHNHEDWSNKEQETRDGSMSGDKSYSTMSVFIFHIITHECTMECIQPRNEVTPQGE